MVPNGWTHCTFGELIKSGGIEKIQDGNHGNSHPKSSDFVTSGIPFVMARDLKKGTINLKHCAYITKKQADSLRIGFAITGDILLSHKGTVGEVAIVPECDDYMMLTPQVTYYRVVNDSHLLNTYLYQFLLSSSFQSSLKSLAGQSTRSYLGITAQKELSIKFPPLPEQRKIAKILSTWDKAIATTEKLIATSKQQKKALMQQLLTGKKRLCSSPKDGAETGLAFEGEWEEVELSSISTLITNGFVGTATPFYTDNTGIPYLYGVNVKNNKINKKSLRYVTKEFHKKQSKTNLSVGDLLMVQSGHIGETAVVTEAFSNSNCHALIVTKFIRELVYSDFISFYFNSEIGKARLKNLEVGSTIKHINTKDLKKFKVPLPIQEEQQKIASVLTVADKEIELLQTKLSHFKQEKKALMQQLLTGKRRVMVEEDQTHQ